MSITYIKSERISNILVEGFMYHFEKMEYIRQYGDAYVLKINLGHVHIIGDINNEKISKNTDHYHVLITRK